MRKAFALFKKDFRSEIRTRYAINALIMFIIVTISVIFFSIGQEKINESLTAGLFWVVIFFSAMSGLSRVFVSEEERGTTMLLHLTANPSTIFSGKFLFNLILVFAMNLVIVFLFSVVSEVFILKSLGIFVLTFILGSIGLAISSTIIAAIISKAGAKGTLYPVLSFPILLPLILTSVQLTIFSIDGTKLDDSSIYLMILLSYDIIMVAVSYMLFDFIWKD